MKKNCNPKTFNQAIDLVFLEKVSDILVNNYDAFAHAYSFKRDKNNRKHKFEYYNLLCTCIIRIRETSHYLNKFKFKQENVCGQAFDFYEFINCLSIIYNCTESILNIFGIDLKSYLSNKRYFVKSNSTKESDYKFFKFVRSAAVAHPDNTSYYFKIAKRTNEIYPYAVWTSAVFDLFKDEKNKDADISLLSWASSERSQYKRYYLYINEFFDFINSVTKSIKDVAEHAETIAKKYKEKHRCKRLKKESDFNNYHDYLMYLRKRLLKLNTNKYEFPDGGILIADHIFSNKLITKSFKKYLKERVKLLSTMMIEDYDEIGFNTIFDELDLYKVIKDKCDDSHYIDSKFDLYLGRHARHEIENNEYSKFIPELAIYKDDPASGSDAFWAVYKLFSCDIFLSKYKSYPNYQDLSYADIYEMSLEIIYNETIAEKQ